MLELVILTVELLDIVPGGIGHRVTGKPLLTRFHELLGPCVTGA